MKEILNAVYDLDVELQEILDTTNSKLDLLEQQYQKNLEIYRNQEEEHLRQNYTNQADKITAEYERKRTELQQKQDSELQLSLAVYEQEKPVLIKAILDYVCHFT